MSKEFDFKEFNLDNIQWNKIKGGLTKEELCKGNKKLECIFDAINKDKIEDKLSNAEIQAFHDTLIELSNDDFLDKKEAKQFRNAEGKKTNYKDIFAFLMELRKHESTDEDLITVYTITEDGEEVEVSEYQNERIEKAAVDGSWTKATEFEETPEGRLQRDYLNGTIIRTTIKNGSVTIINDIPNKILTKIIDIGNGLQKRELTETPSVDYKKVTSIEPTGDTTVTEYRTLYFGFTSITKTMPDKSQTVDYNGRLYMGDSFPLSYIEMDTIKDYIQRKYFYELDDRVIPAIKNSGIDPESQKKYISGIVNRIIQNSSVLADYSTKELQAELDRYMNGEVSDVGNLQSLYKQTAQALEVTKTSNLNGLIDEDFEQGGAGDCYLLAVIKSLTLNENTEKIINDTVKIDKNGNARVTLKGVNKTFTVTKAELERDGYSYGDPDVRAIEIAVEKYLKKYGDPFDRGDFTLADGLEKSAYFLLTGKTAYEYKGAISDKLLNQINNKKTIACAAISNEGDAKILFKSAQDEDAVLVTQHSYTISNIDQNYVYLINPWNTSITLQLTKTDFKKYFNNVTILSV